MFSMDGQNERLVLFAGLVAAIVASLLIHHLVVCSMAVTCLAFVLASSAKYEVCYPYHVRDKPRLWLAKALSRGLAAKQSRRKLSQTPDVSPASSAKGGQLETWSILPSKRRSTFQT